MNLFYTFNKETIYKSGYSPCTSFYRAVYKGDKTSMKSVLNGQDGKQFLSNEPIFDSCRLLILDPVKELIAFYVNITNVV